MLVIEKVHLLCSPNAHLVIIVNLVSIKCMLKVHWSFLTVVWLVVSHHTSSKDWYCTNKYLSPEIKTFSKDQVWSYDHPKVQA